MNITVGRNRESENLEIRVPALVNRLFCAWLCVHFYGNIRQGLAASAVRSSLYQYSHRNYDPICTKMNIKSDFHITRQLMESHPKYSTSEQNVTKYISNIFYFFNYFKHQWILHCHFYSNIYNCATIPGLAPWAHQLFRHTILSITPR